MKTLTAFVTAYKSLLLAGGLLLISGAALHGVIQYRGHILKTGPMTKEIKAMEGKIDSGEMSLFHDIAGRLFPVLKNLNKM